MTNNNPATKDDLKLLEKKIDEFTDQIISATGKGFEELNNKIDSTETELKKEIRYLKDDVNNLKADSPSKIEFQNHEKRISRLEKATFPPQSL